MTSIFHSINGNIDITTSNNEIHTLFYAPNGEVNINNSIFNLYGGIIADKIEVGIYLMQVKKNVHDFPYDLSEFKSRLVLVE